MTNIIPSNKASNVLIAEIESEGEITLAQKISVWKLQKAGNPAARIYSVLKKYYIGIFVFWKIKEQLMPIININRDSYKIARRICVTFLLFASFTSGELLAETYSWNDGRQTHTLQMLPSMEAEFTRSGVDILSKSGAIQKPATSTSPPDQGSNPVKAQSAPQSQNAPNTPSKTSPVFRDSAGRLRALPGGVLVIFHSHLTAQDRISFWHDRGININDVTALTSIKGLYKVQTPAGMSSLYLSNTLAEYPEVKFTSPNWWKESVKK